MVRLVAPDPRHRTSFLGFAAELVDEGRAGDDSMLGRHLSQWGDRWHTEAGFAAYVASLRAAEQEAEPGFVTHTTWWWVTGRPGAEQVVGRINLRHRLTERLREVGGHVGYDVRPSARRRGHATAMLGALLPEAAARGIDPVLVTCDHDNTGSRLAIERNGGVLEDQRGAKLRFWVPTGASR